jgi:Erythromycin esterase
MTRSRDSAREIGLSRLARDMRAGLVQSAPSQIAVSLWQKAESMICPRDRDFPMNTETTYLDVRTRSSAGIFYRAQISKRLILERGFRAVAVEADWPDAYRINTFIRGASDDTDSVEALNGFKRFPQWMWRNADVLDFVGWLREHNNGQPSDNKKCGFYGLDLYSLHASIEAVLGYLTKVDPEAASRARRH